MHFLIISQVFYPDSTAVAQLLHDFGKFMLGKGHRVTVICSKHTYEQSALKLKKNDEVDGIQILRLNHSNFGKKTILGRVLDFLTFNLAVFFKLFSVKKKDYDAIIGMTTPPLLPFICLLFSKRKKIPFYYWAMDLQPELAIYSNLIKEHSIQARLLSFFSNFAFKHSDKIIALDDDMKRYIQSRTKASIEVVPPWSLVPLKAPIKREDNAFRKTHGLDNNIVIMYSGNHSFIHPLSCLLDAAKLLKEESRFKFLFVGEGVQKKEIAAFKEKHQLANILLLPFEPLEKIHISLSAADYQVVTMGNNFIGYTHPNKIYGAMYSGRKIIYTGPKNSFIYTLLQDCPTNISLSHNDGKALSEQLLADSADINAVLEQGNSNLNYAKNNFDPDKIKAKLYNFLMD